MCLYRSQKRVNICSISSSWLIFFPPRKKKPLNSGVLKHVESQSDKWNTGQGLEATRNRRETLVLIGVLTDVTGTGKVFLFWWMYLCKSLLAFVLFRSLREIAAIVAIFGSYTPKLQTDWIKYGVWSTRHAHYIDALVEPWAFFQPRVRASPKLSGSYPAVVQHLLH